MMKILRLRGAAVRWWNGCAPAVFLLLSGCATSGGGAPWTILCMERTGPDRVRYVDNVAASLKRTPGVRAADVYSRDGSDGVARLYYGAFHRPIDGKTGRYRTSRRLRGDLDLIKQLGAKGGRPIFLGARPVRVPQFDVGNPEWNLRYVDARYSLQVAVFEPRDSFWEFKQAAAEYCAHLRGLGHEAYYHHSEASSVVTVGAFGASAVITGADGRTYYSAAVQALQSVERLKHNLLNGAIYGVRNDEGEMLRVPSRLVEIPRPDRDASW